MTASHSSIRRVAPHAGPDVESFAAPTISLKLVAIGNSYGVRLSRPLLHKYGMEHTVVAEQRPDGLLLRGVSPQKATLDQTFTEMAAAQENWNDFETTSADGLDKLAW